MKASRLLLLSMALSPAMLLGQKKEDLLSIQRDIADMTDRVKQLQKAFDEKIAALTALVQQSIDTSNKTSAAMVTMQHSVDQKMADQQVKLVTPLATMGAKVDEMSGDFRSVQTNVAELVRHLNTLDDKVKDISDAIRSLQAPPAAPPPAAGAAGTAAQQAPDACVGASVDLSYTTALGDYNGKKDDLALQEFHQYVKCFPQSANAPNAAYYVGQIYYRAEDWPNAVQAFDDVVEKFPTNPKTSEAAYYKAISLMKNKQRTDAGKEFKNFISNYPESTHVKEAHLHLRELGMEAAPRNRKN
jgi:TolA-binding protein